MNFKTTLILLALLVVVGAFVVMDRVRSTDAPPPATPADSSTPNALLSLSEYDVTRLALSGEKLPAFAIEKQGNDKDAWNLSGAVTAPADPAQALNHIRRFTSLTGKGEPSSEVRQSFKPVLSATLTAGGKTVTVDFSSPTAVGEAFARIVADGKTTWAIVPGETVEQLAKPASTFRDPRLVTALPADISDLWLEYEDVSLHLVRADSGDGWRIHSTSGSSDSNSVQADTAEVDELLRTLTTLRAESFLTDTPEGAFTYPQLTLRYALFSPPSTQPTTRRTRLEGLQGGGQGVRIGRFEDARKQRLLATRFNSASPVGSEVVTLRAGLLQNLRKSALDLRDKNVLTLTPQDITQIQIVNPTLAATRPETALTLKPVSASSTQSTTQPGVTANTPAWTVNDAPADPNKIDALLKALSPLRTTRYLQGEGATLVVTPWLVRIHTTDGQVRELSIGNQAAQFDGLTFVPETELLPLIDTPFTPPPQPIPFLNAADPAPAQATQP